MTLVLPMSSWAEPVRCPGGGRRGYRHCCVEADRQGFEVNVAYAELFVAWRGLPRCGSVAALLGHWRSW